MAINKETSSVTVTKNYAWELNKTIAKTKREGEFDAKIYELGLTVVSGIR